MGYISHHAIVVTSYGFGDWAERGHSKAVELGCLVSPVIKGAVNGYESFFVAPDGSKEGWEESEQGDIRRNMFVAWLEAPEQATWFDWAEIRYGDGDGVASLIRASDETLTTGGRYE